MVRKLFLYLILLSASIVFLPVRAQIAEEFPTGSILNPKEFGNGYVSNADQLITASTVRALNETLTKLDKDKKAQVAIVMVNSIGKAIPKQFANKLFRSWGIGERDTDNGLLILVVKDQRRVEFEVGYGLEGVLPDIMTNRIQQQVMVPRLKAGDYDRALLAGIDRLAVLLYASKQELQAANDGLEFNPIKRYMGWDVAKACIALFSYYAFFGLYSSSAGGKRVLHQSSCLLALLPLIAPIAGIVLLAFLTDILITWDIVLLIGLFSYFIVFAVHYYNKYAIARKKSKEATQ